MQKALLLLCLLFSLSAAAWAQTTVSYGQLSCYCPQTGTTIPGDGAVIVTFYDDYIDFLSHGKLKAVQRNPDGSTTYVPTESTGTPALRLNAVLISADRKRMEERMTSTMGNMSIDMIYSFMLIAEDGGAAARSRLNAKTFSGSGGGGSYGSSRSGGCSYCGGTGKCSSCSGNGGQWMDSGYYTGSGSKSWISCGSCRGSKRCFNCYGTGKQR